ncbi:hypothetical protein QUB47_19040 [Microcoleus sp. AT9_B5]
MGKGVYFASNGTNVYGYVANFKSEVYTGAIATATGLTQGDMPRPAVPVPWRLQDLLQARVIRRVVVVLNDGLNKRTNRTLYVTAEKAPTIRNLNTAGGLVGATLGGKTILSASIPRKSSSRLA